MELNIRPAAARALEKIGRQHAGKVLRMRVEQVCGCGKMGFDFSWEAEPRPEDERAQSGGVTIVADAENRPFIDGAVIDYDDGIMEKKFVITHPNVVTECQGPPVSH